MPYVYILECNDMTLYTGSAMNLEKRIDKHNSGIGAKYTRARIPVRLVYFEEYKTYNEALKRENEIKKWKKKRKQALIYSR